MKTIIALFNLIFLATITPAFAAETFTVIDGKTLSLEWHIADKQVLNPEMTYCLAAEDGNAIAWEIQQGDECGWTFFKSHRAFQIPLRRL